MIRIFSQYVSPKSLLLVILEDVLIALSLLVGAWLRFWNNSVEFENYVRLPEFGRQILIVVVVFQVCFYYSNLYNFAAIRRRYQLLMCLGQSLGTASLLLGITYYIFPSLLIGRGVFFIGITLVAISVIASRLVLDHAWQFAARKENILLFGAGALAVRVARELGRRDDLNIVVAGFIVFVHSDAPTEMFGRPI